MKKYFFACITLLIVSRSWSQVYQPISFPEKVEKRYTFDAIGDEAKYRKKIAKKVPKKYLKPFTFSNAFGKSEMFKDGDIYLNWNRLELYVNQILDSIIPDNLKSKKIRAYIGRSSEINAFCLYDGTMIVNVGLISEVKNEAALATIMGHELGHYIKDHVLKDYIKNVTEKSSRKKDQLELAINRKGYSQQLELEADEQGYSLARSVGYDVNQAITNFELFIREKEYYTKRNKSSLANDDTVKIKTKTGTFTANTLEKMLSTHPDEKERKDKLVSFIKTNPLTKKQCFKMDSLLFYDLQNTAKLESISLTFSHHNYSECLERAFRFHLLEPKNETFHYYIAECIRRICLLDYTMRKKGFLAENFTNNGFKDGEGILHDLKYLIPNTDQYKKIKATELTVVGSYKFETYYDAFYYFIDKLVKSNYSEAYLLAALFENNKTKQKTNIDKYLSHPKAMRKEYARNYLSNSLTTSIATNSDEITMIPKVDYFSHTTYNKNYSSGVRKYNFSRSETTGSELSANISNYFNAHIPNVKAISLSQASTENFNTKEKYEEMITSTFLAKREENEGYSVVHYYKELADEDYIGKIDIFRLNPEIWDFFNKNKINTISYLYYTRHLSESDKITRRPAFYMGFPTLGFTWLFLPMRIANYKELDMITFDSKAGEVLYFNKIKFYWLTSKKASKMYKKLKHKKADYITEMYGK